MKKVLQFILVCLLFCGCVVNNEDATELPKATTTEHYLDMKACKFQYEGNEYIVFSSARYHDWNGVVQISSMSSYSNKEDILKYIESTRNQILHYELGAITELKSERPFSYSSENDAYTRGLENASNAYRIFITEEFNKIINKLK